MLISYVGQAEGAAPTHYYEVDFPEVTRKKAAIIANRDTLQKIVGQKLDAQAIGDVPTAYLLTRALGSSLLSACYATYMTATITTSPLTQHTNLAC